MNPVLEVLKAGRAVRLYIGQGRKEKVPALLKEAGRRKIPVEFAAPEFFNRFPKGHQSVAAMVKEKKLAESARELLEIARKKGEPPFLIALDEVEDPRNLGAIMRTAYAAGVHGLIIQKHRQAGLSPEVYKTSAGAAERLPVLVEANIKYALDRLKEEGLLIIGAEGGDERGGIGIAPWDVDLSGPLVLVLGGEDTGIRKVVKERCDHILSLPLAGDIGSLNVSVAAGAFIFEILRQRRSKPDK